MKCNHRNREIIKIRSSSRVMGPNTSSGEEHITFWCPDCGSKGNRTEYYKINSRGEQIITNKPRVRWKYPAIKRKADK